MAHRALIIAIESYPQMSGGIQQTLPGTLQAGENFRDWLLAKWQAEGVKDADQQVLFCSSPAIAGGRPADADDIRAALEVLRTDGQNATEELYVFFSGHGFAFADARHDLTDYILTADCKSPRLSPGCCLPFDHLVTWLRDHLGPGRHFHFVDACRNVLTVGEADPGSLGLTKDRGASGEPSTFVLQSTHQGAVAVVSTEFPAALLGGLKGSGKAKVYDDDTPDAMFVHYGSLREYVKDALRNQKAVSRTTGDVSEGDALLFTFKPIPSVACTVRVDGLEAGDAGTISLRRERGPLAQRRVTERPMTGAVTTIPLEPDRYTIGVSIDGAEVSPATAIAVDVFDDTTTPAFTRNAIGAGAGAGSGAQPAAVPRGGPLFPPQARVRGGAPTAGAPPPPPAPAPPPPGPAWDVSLPHRSIASAFPHSDDGIDFSESLGWVHDMDLDVWLAIIGAGRIMPFQVGDFSKIGPLPLHDFGSEVPGASPVYVLAGLAEDPLLEISVSGTTTPQWQPALPVAGLPGVQHLYVPAAPGPQFISLRLAGHPTRTIVSLTSPNRATLVTLSNDEDGGPQAWQYLLPLGHLIAHLPPDVRTQVESRSSPLQDVRNLAAAGRAFRRRRDMASELEPALRDELFHTKWIDPIGSALVAYQALRNGDKGHVAMVAGNMLTAFPELPDSHALATLAGLPGAAPQGVPLFLDGLRAYPDDAAILPFPEKLLDVSGPWTAWRRAV